jgi:putative DNA-invertase from lambdoid prophage Rac
MRAALYARVLSHDEQTLGLLVVAMATYLRDREWHLGKRVEDLGSRGQGPSGA